MNPAKYISFELSFASAGYGSINAVNLDIKNYGNGDATKFDVALYDSNNTLVGTTTMGNSITTSWQDYTLDFTSVNGGATSVVGSTDAYEVRIYGYDVNGTNTNPRLGLDHVRVLGDVNCVPEPSSFLLSALGGLVLLRRRR